MPEGERITALSAMDRLMTDETDSGMKLMRSGNLKPQVARQVASEDELYTLEIGVDDTEGSKDNEIGIKKYSAATPGEEIIGIIKGIFDGDTKDGEIGETQQHATGDCWLLTGVNALSYTEEGRKMIKSCLEYKNGYTIVHLKGVGDIKVYNWEVDGTKGSSQYSTGDDDMIIFELAIEKVLDMVAKGELKFDKPLNASANDRTATSYGQSSSEAGYIQDAIYYITGIPGKFVDNEDMEEAINQFQANGGKNLAMGVSVCEETTVKDIYGNEITLSGPHAYAIKEVTDDTVTIVNPWDSSKEIVLSRETFLGIKSAYMDVTDLSDKPKDLTMKPKVDKDGNKTYERNCSSWEADGYPGDKSDICKEITVYAKDGTIKEAKYLDKDGNVLFIRKYDKDGNLESSYSFNPNGYVGVSMKYDKDGKVTELKIYNTHDADRTDDKNFAVMTFNDRLAKIIQKRGLLSYTQFSAQSLYELALMSDSQWEKAKAYLDEHPNATLKELKEAANKPNESGEGSKGKQKSMGKLSDLFGKGIN